MGSSLPDKVVGGCPQGRVHSPLLWNLVVDTLLTVTNDLGFKTFVYAYNIVIIVQCKFTHTVRHVMQQALKVVIKLAAKEGLNISPQKQLLFHLPKGRKRKA
jgi:hypothetical protein